MKVCTDCKQEKLKSEFSTNKTKKDGLNYRCKICQRIYFKDYYEKNKTNHLKRVAKVNKKNEKNISNSLMI